jgi:hypothetical protein
MRLGKDGVDGKQEGQKEKGKKNPTGNGARVCILLMRGAACQQK